jgi:RNA polymerase sigma factor for flagellar operon FliA
MLTGKETDINSVAREMGVTQDEVHRIVSHMSLRSVVSLDRMLWSDDGDEVAFSAVVSVDPSLDPAGVFEQREAQMILFEAIGQLPERDQQILALYYIEEMTLREIAAVYDLTEGRVSQLHSRAIARLRLLLKEQEAS